MAGAFAAKALQLRPPAPSTRHGAGEGNESQGGTANGRGETRPAYLLELELGIPPIVGIRVQACGEQAPQGGGIHDGSGAAWGVDGMGDGVWQSGRKLNLTTGASSSSASLSASTSSSSSIRMKESRVKASRDGGASRDSFAPVQKKNKDGHRQGWWGLCGWCNEKWIFPRADGDSDE
jgi:hypothetical protein